jgi:hypothetical protein
MEHGTFLRGGELDLLGFYLTTGLNLGPTEFDTAHTLQLIGASDAIDTYHYRRIEGLPAERPAPRRTEWLGRRPRPLGEPWRATLERGRRDHVQRER